MSIKVLAIESLISAVVVLIPFRSIEAGILTGASVLVLGFITKRLKEGAYFVGPITMIGMWGGVFTASLLARSHEVSAHDLLGHLFVGASIGWVIGLAIGLAVGNAKDRTFEQSMPYTQWLKEHSNYREEEPPTPK